MTTNTHDERLKEAQDIRQDEGTQFHFKITSGLLLVALLAWVGIHLFAGDDDGFSYQTNVYTEAISIVVTVLILNTLAEMREVRQLKDHLIRNAAGTSNETAKDAIHQLSVRDWLTGDKRLLRETDLRRANLHGAFLVGADLSEATLDDDLSGANLWLPNLSGTKLEDADLTDTLLAEAHFDENTTLPDGSKWTPDPDLTAFGAYIDVEKWNAEVRDKRSDGDT